MARSLSKSFQKGTGAGALMPVGRTLIGDVYHGADRARMQGYVSGVFVGAAVSARHRRFFSSRMPTTPMVFWMFGLMSGAILLWALHERVERRPPHRSGRIVPSAPAR